MRDKSLILNENYPGLKLSNRALFGFKFSGLLHTWGKKFWQGKYLVSSNIWPAMCVTYISNIFKYVLLYSL